MAKVTTDTERNRDDRTPPAFAGRRGPRRLFWFMLLWAGGVLTVTLVGIVIRLLMDATYSGGGG